MREYKLDTCQLRAGTPVLVDRSAGHFWFSSLHAAGDDRILCDVGLTDDVAQGKWPGLLYLSKDGGHGWHRVAEPETHSCCSVQLDPDRLLLMPYETWPLSSGDKRNAKAEGTIVAFGKDDAVEVEPVWVQFLDFPFDLADYYQGELLLLTDGNILPLRDGRLFCTVYGKVASDEKYSLFAGASEDEGVTWRFLSVVAGGADVPDAREGPNESNAVRLGDDRLFCVFRVGGYQTYHKAYSADEGRSWTKPEPVEGTWSVEPKLVRLGNGAILLCGGRPGLLLWICTDGQGQRWERFNLADHHNALFPDPAMHYSDRFRAASERVRPDQSTAYPGMIAVGPEEVLISYDRLGNGWTGAPGPWGETDAVFCVRLQVTSFR